MSTTNTVRGFAGDRAHLSGLLEEIRVRLLESEKRRDWTFSIGPLVATIRELELAERIGFHGPPLRRYKGVVPRDAREEGYFLDDPYQSSSGVAVTMRFQRDVGTSTSHDVLSASHREDARLRILAIVETWIRAVGRASPPEPYPAQPHAPVGVAVTRYTRDPLCRLLRNTVAAIRSRTFDRTTTFDVWAWPEWIPRLQSLARYEGLLMSDLFGVRCKKGGKQVALCIASPTGGEMLLLPFKKGGQIARRSQLLLAAQLEEWQRVRAIQLDNAHASTLADASPRPSPMRQDATSKVKPGRGRKAVYDPDQDAKLVDDWRASGMARNAFERARGLEQGAVVKARDRCRQRRSASSGKRR